jgi:hypothetical protein
MFICASINFMPFPNLETYLPANLAGEAVLPQWMTGGDQSRAIHRLFQKRLEGSEKCEKIERPNDFLIMFFECCDRYENFPLK